MRFRPFSRLFIPTFFVAAVGLGVSGCGEDEVAVEANAIGDIPEVFEQDDLFEIAESFPMGAGTAGLSGTGAPEDVWFRNRKILSKDPGGSFCCGYTFVVLMKVAAQRQLLDDFEAQDVRDLLTQCYGDAPGYNFKQIVLAIKNNELGWEVEKQDILAGDFIQFHRMNHSGHQAFFKRWLYYEDKVIGLEYLGSQGSTNGVGLQQEYFHGLGVEDGQINPELFYAARLRPGQVVQLSKDD